MKKVICWLVFTMLVLGSQAQSVSARLAAAYASFEDDSQLKSGIASVYVVDGSTGSVVFEKNARIGLAPASTQKIITAATAYELLGRDFRYQTKFGYSGSLKDGKADGLHIQPSGDPTLGSWRWPGTSEDAVMKRVLVAMQVAKINSFSTAYFDKRGWESEAIPGGWIWDDIGNYYGAGADALNWRENQYDLVMKSGRGIGDAVIVLETKPRLYNIYFDCRVTAAAKGTGDNSYIYLPVGGNVATVRGTIPVQEDRFTISGAIPSAPTQFFSTLNDTLARNGYPVLPDRIPYIEKSSKMAIPTSVTVFHTEQSPTLDSISYWFLKKSINLYGEALAKTLALRKGKTASSANGANAIRNYWKEKGIGIDITELNMQDGSGLSPQNRVTTHAQVAILLYAKKQHWFDGYFAGFPEYNGMKLKSGTIAGAKGFCGYHTAKDGKQYIVSFVVNNYNGSASALVQKMYKVLDVLK